MAAAIISRKDARAQGLKRYFTGRPCKHGHISQRQTSSAACFACEKSPERNALKRRWDQASRQSAPVSNQESARRLRRLARESGGATYFTGEACRRGHLSARFVGNRECVACRGLRYRSFDYLQAKAASYARCPEAAVARVHTRRARISASEGTHTAADLAEILAAQGGRCAYCRIDLKKTKKHVDHIVALAAGGSNARSNLQYLCQPCNQSKSARDPIVFAQFMGLLL